MSSGSDCGIGVSSIQLSTRSFIPNITRACMCWNWASNGIMRSRMIFLPALRANSLS
eukprot:COSAG02_NODE_5569_length_4224_cov_1.810424_3_plen_57_part_00